MAGCMSSLSRCRRPQHPTGPAAGGHRHGGRRVGADAPLAARRGGRQAGAEAARAVRRGGRRAGPRRRGLLGAAAGRRGLARLGQLGLLGTAAGGWGLARRQAARRGGGHRRPPPWSGHLAASPLEVRARVGPPPPPQARPPPLAPSPTLQLRHHGRRRSPPPAAVAPPLQAASAQIKGVDRFPAAPSPFPPSPGRRRALGRRRGPPLAPCPPSSVSRERGGRRAKLPKGPCPFLLLFKSPPSLLHGTGAIDMARVFLSFDLVLNTVNSPSRNRGKWNLQIQKIGANMQS